ncbi:MAG TPA: hypothetical protein VK544_10365 [Gemmatimonadaceae bacterium]|nr:hypothetical protein [Gemmatimonadaceae bacterium]
MMNSLKQVLISRGLRAVASAAVLGCAGTLGCYTYVPAQASYLQPGREVAIDINDLGRVNLSTQIGAEVARVSGILQQQTGTDYAIRVNELTYLNGRTAMWSGESVVVRQDYVRGVFEKKVSPGKTAAAVLASAGVVGGAIAAHTLIVGGSGNGGGDRPEPPPNTGYRGHP